MRTLPFVDADSVRPSLAKRQVTFRAKPNTAFDLAATKKALRDAGYDDIQLAEKPKPRSP